VEAQEQILVKVVMEILQFFQQLHQQLVVEAVIKYQLQE